MFYIIIKGNISKIEKCVLKILKKFYLKKLGKIKFRVQNRFFNLNFKFA